ncbi:MAG: ATP-binding cassette domain-containing protein [Victivallales bacterium]|nr:ATP-binding cassette domain-containing protein [Victivallales bacterium]
MRSEAGKEKRIIVEVDKLCIGYGQTIILKDISFSVEAGVIFGILGGSGAGKSTLLKHIIGLYPPFSGDVRIFGRSIINCSENCRNELMRAFGVTYQGGALFGSMTVGENIALPLETYTDLTATEIMKVVQEKLALVDLEGTENLMPSELSGGMKKRAGLARAMALDPELLFFDEPSAGLDPITSVELDELLLRLRRQLGTTIVIVTHELASIFDITDTVIMLDKNAKTIAASGDPRKLRDKSDQTWVHDFLNRQAYHPAPQQSSINLNQENIYGAG